MRKFYITKTFRFDAAHRIWIDRENSENDNPYKCENIHGHTFIVEFTFKADEIGKKGMVVDTEIIKKIVSDIIEKFDHSLIIHKDDPLRSKIEKIFDKYKILVLDVMPTAEGIAFALYQKIKSKMEYSHINKAKIIKVKVKMTPSIWSEYVEDKDESKSNG